MRARCRRAKPRLRNIRLTEDERDAAIEALEKMLESHRTDLELWRRRRVEAAVTVMRWNRDGRPSA